MKRGRLIACQASSLLAKAILPRYLIQVQGIGWLSILPPIIAIALAIGSRQVYLALGLYIWLGWTLIHGGNPVMGLIASINEFILAVSQPANLRTLIFSGLVGSMIVFTQRSGGMQGFINWIDEKGVVRTRRAVQLLTLAVSLPLFLESNFGLLVSGSVARPLFDKFRISREKLAYVIDASCAPKCILIPLNGWGAYVIGLLAAEGVERPVALLVATLPMNFYPILALLLVLGVVWFDWNPGPMGRAERRTLGEGKILAHGAKPLVSSKVSMIRTREGIPERSVNMVLPLVAMMLTVPIVLYHTGGGDITVGDGSKAILWGVVVGLVAGAAGYRIQGIMTFVELRDSLIEGIQGLTPVVVILALAFTIASTTRALGTGYFVAHAAESALHPGLVPALIFCLACFIAFSTGTSWGTFAIMVPIVLPMTQVLDLNIPLALGAAMGGGIFGDHCSPISDSTIVASMASATDHIEHVKTQLPYALMAAAGALFLFLVFGFLA